MSSNINTLDIVSSIIDDIISEILVPLPFFSEKEYNHYKIFSEKIKFSSPEDEYIWAKTQQKKCSKCNVEKKLIEFKGNTCGRDAFDQSGYRLRRPECESCTKKVQQGKSAAIKLAKNAGISFKPKADQMCENCGVTGRKGNIIVFDHDHKTEKFRGWLCNSCNRSIGVLGDDIYGMVRTLNYMLKTTPTKIHQDENGFLRIV